MKYFSKIFTAVIGLSLILAACSKIDNLSKQGALPTYANGTAPVLTTSSTAITPQPSDSNNVMVTFSWSNPHYATDSSTQKYILEIDSTGRNFAKEITTTVVGKLSTTFTGAQLNNLLASFGFTPGQTFTFDCRVTSSYGNNNEQRQSTNPVTVKITSYLVPITLSPSSSSPLTLLVANATSKAVSFNWTATNYGSNNINYAIQFDTVGGNFTAPQVIQYGNLLTSSMIVNDLNNYCIAAGVQGGATKKVEFKIVSYLGAGYIVPLVISNIVQLTITTFTPVPPNLYIVGDATPGGWNNPVPTPSQQFTRLDAVSYGIVVNLTAGKSYLFLPLNGDWSHKYGGATDGTASGGGALLQDNAVPGSNTPAPATSGLYQIIVNFQTGKYTITPFTASIPTNLYIVGDATAGQWNNPVPVPSQQFTQLDAGSYGIVVNLTAGKSYLFLPLNGDWGHKFGGGTDGTATSGTLLADNAVPGSNTPAPATSGNYLIVVNFINNTYKVTPYAGPMPAPTNLYIVGDATPGGWNNPVPVPSQQFTRIGLTDYQITVPLAATGSYLWLPLNGDWGHKFGGTSATGGAILADNAVPGSNTPGPGVAGNYLIDVNFLTNTYTVTKQ